MTTDLDSHTDFANAVAVQADGKIVVAGRTFFNDPYGNFALVRYNPDGSLDASFGVDGVVITDSAGFLSGFSFGWDEAKALALQPDGKIIVGGTFYADSSANGVVLLRYNPDGSLDTTFGYNGATGSSDASGPDIFRGLALQDDGKILLAGSYTLYRFHSDGSPDLTFGEYGRVSGYSGSLAAQPDGKILVATQYAVLVRYNPDGSLDTSFGNGGTVAINFFPTDLAVQPDGKIVVAGAPFFILARYNPDGSLDTSFGSGGIVGITVLGPFYVLAKALALQPDGKILLAGYALRRIPRPTPKFALARYNTDGSLDTDFGSDGKVVTDVTNSQVDLARDLALQADGKIVVAGVAGGDIALARYLGDAEE